MLRRSYCLTVILVFCWLLTSIDSVGASTVPGGAVKGSADLAEIVTGKALAEQLERAAEALYGYVLEGDVTKVRQVTDEISKIFVSSSFEGLTTVEGINALSGVIIDLKAAVAAVTTAPGQIETEAVKLRLAVNSLNHPEQPIWLQYYKLVHEDLNAMESSGAVNDLVGWKTALERLQTRYENIRPAVIVSRQPEIVIAFDSWLSYAGGILSSSQKIERTRLIEIVSYGQDVLRVMFGKEKNEQALSLPLSQHEFGVWGGLAASFIICSLAYVAYRKYRGENQKWKPV